MPRPTHILLSGIAALALAAGVAWLVWPRSTPVNASLSHPVTGDHQPRLPLLPVVEKIIREGPQLPYLKFTFLIKELPLDLSPQDIDALLAFISGPQPRSFEDGEWGSLVNDIEECLTVQTAPSEKVAHALIAIFRDESKSQMQRDYALQHVGGFLIYLIHTERSVTNNPPSSQSPNSNLQALLLSELKSAAADTSKPWSGTALNLLDGSLRAADYRTVEIPGLSRQSLTSLSIAAFQDPSAPLNARIPALQAAARCGSPEALAAARDILAAPSSPLMLVQVAASVVSQLGDKNDLPLLNSRLAANEKHARIALSQAIQTLSAN